MSLAKSYMLSGGLFVESDILSLSPQMIVSSSYLEDTITHARHGLSKAALQLVSVLKKGKSFKDLYSLALRLQVTDLDFTSFLTDLHDVGGLQLKRQPKGYVQWVVCVVLLLRYGIRPQSRLVASVATLRGLMSGVLLALKWLLGCAPIMIILLYGFGYAWSIAAALVIFFLALLWGSTVVHELVHRQFLVKNNSKAIFLRRGLRIGILHPRQSDLREVISAIAGPLSGSLLCLVFVELIGKITYSTEFHFIAWSCAIFHMISLWPAYSDGGIVLRYIKGRHNEA